MHRAHAHITNRQPLKPVNTPFFAQHGVEVGQDLGGVFTPTIATIDNRHRRPLGGFMRRTLLEVAHHNHITVELQHLDRVLNRFLIPIPRAGHLSIRETGHMPTQAVHGSFVRQAGAGARLVEGGYQGLVTAQIDIFPITGNIFHFAGNIEYVEELLPFELLQRKDIATSKTTHCEKPP